MPCFTSAARQASSLAKRWPNRAGTGVDCRFDDGVMGAHARERLLRAYALEGNRDLALDIAHPCDHPLDAQLAHRCAVQAAQVGLERAGRFIRQNAVEVSRHALLACDSMSRVLRSISCRMAVSTEVRRSLRSSTSRSMSATEIVT